MTLFGAALAPLEARSIETSNEPIVMLHYTILFLVVALVAGILGFGVVAGTAAMIAKICFFVFLVFFLVSLITGRRPAA